MTKTLPEHWEKCSFCFRRAPLLGFWLSQIKGKPWYRADKEWQNVWICKSGRCNFCEDNNLKN